MHSVRLKLFAEFTKVHTTPLPAAGDVPFSHRRRRSRNCKLIVARASDADGAENQQQNTWFFERNQMYALMKQQLEIAAMSEVTFFVSTLN